MGGGLIAASVGRRNQRGNGTGSCNKICRLFGEKKGEGGERRLLPDLDYNPNFKARGRERRGTRKGGIQKGEPLTSGSVIKTILATPDIHTRELVPCDASEGLCRI